MASRRVLVKRYDRFVTETDVTAGSSPAQRLDVAIYGLIGEIGSLVSAVKKRLKYADPNVSWNSATDEIIEEMGDVAWYSFALARIANQKAPVNILMRSILNLRRQLKNGPTGDQDFRNALGEERCRIFIERSHPFPLTATMTFNDYQRAAVLTARTQGEELRDVCITVLWEAGAELLRYKLPDIERVFNQQIKDNHINAILEKVAWHIAVLADIYGVTLDQVISENIKKVSFRRKRGVPTPLHDEKPEIPEHERLPRVFEVSFITVGPRSSRMYIDGKQFGDELTDNSYEADGYRFHDILHLANIAKLGWSPVFRGLFKRKRKSNSRTDEVEDGARARIVEEAVIKAVHSEGVKLSGRKGHKNLMQTRLFPEANMITFALLQRINIFVEGVEVHANKFWEWEESIMAGYEIFNRLCRERQGTVSINLAQRSIVYRPEVCIDIKGTLAGVGEYEVAEAQCGDHEGHVELTNDETERCKAAPLPTLAIARAVTAKRALLNAIGYERPTRRQFSQLRLTFLDESKVSVKASGQIERAIWKRKVISFRPSFRQSDGWLACTMFALSDPKD